jgi:C-terminal processing protease CtpA/Prc
MKSTRTFLGICALLLIANQMFAQQQEERKVSVEIEVEENSETKTIQRDFILRDGQSLEEALRELGIMDELGAIDTDERLEIDIRRFLDDEDNGNMQFRFFNEDGNGMVWGDCGPKAFLGVHMESTENASGALVTKVVDESAADEAGLEEGDVILMIDDQIISGTKDLSQIIGERNIDQEVTITYMRNGKERLTTATLQEKQDTHAFMWKSDGDANGNYFNLESHEDIVFNNEPRAFLGVQGNSTADGLKITHVIEGSAAQKAGLLEGDLVLEANGRQVESISGLADELNDYAPGDEVTLRVVREGKRRNITATLGERESKVHVKKFRLDADDDVDFDFDFDMNTDEMTPTDKEEFTRAMKELKEELSNEFREVQKELTEWKNREYRETRVVIVANELSKDEKRMLEKNGVTNLDRELAIDLNLFPNPSDGLFQLDFSSKDRGDLSVDVFDASGNQVYMERLMDMEGSYNGRIDLANRADGNYYLVITKNGRTLTRKLVKQ